MKPRLWSWLTAKVKVAIIFGFFLAVAVFGTEPEMELPHRGCYFPNWSDTRPSSGKYEVHDIDPGYCTYICYAFAGIVNNILTVKPSDELKFVHLRNFKTYYPKLKILLSVGGWNLSHQFPPMAGSAENRTVFIDSVLIKLRTWGLDGLDVDWEYPAHSAVEQYGALLKELRVAFEAEARLLSRTRLLLAAAVSATSRGGYHPMVMARTLDIINLMAYDFHGPTWEPNKTNHNAPLIKSPSDPNHGLNVESLVREWEYVGIPKASISVGLALYGRAWTVLHPDNTGVGVAALGPAPGGAFTEEPGYFGFYEICAGIKAGQLRRQFDRYARVPHASGQNIWVSYDDVESIRQKVMWVRQSGYGGVFAWEMSLDDFRGACFQTRYPLLQTIKRVLTNAADLKPTSHPISFANATAGLPMPPPHHAGALHPVLHVTTPTSLKPSALCATFYQVKGGDTAWNIARTYDISLQDLRQFNPGKVDLDFITQGEKLCVALPNAQRKGSKIHVVERGETAWDIANKHGISLAELQQRNPWKKDWDSLFPGEEMQI